VNAETGRQRLTRAQAKAQTRERLLDAAASLFARRGFAGTSVEQIAESAGYSVGALYSNFASKERLFLELLTTRVSDRIGSVAEILAAAPGADPLDELSRLLVTVADRNAEFVALQAEFWLHAVRNPDFMAAIAGQLREQVEVLERLVAAAMEQRRGPVPGVSARTVTIVVVSLFQGLVRQRLIDPASVPDDLFGQALGWLMTGLRATAAGQAADSEPELPSAGADILRADP
jgi:AcrR family transcriptional regulator